MALIQSRDSRRPVACAVPEATGVNASRAGFESPTDQPTAFLVNTSRGDLVDEAALREAIIDGRLAGAGLDVVEGEPQEVNPFADLSQVIVTPHIAGISVTSAPRAMERAAESIGRFLPGEPIFNVVTG